MKRTAIKRKPAKRRPPGVYCQRKGNRRCSRKMVTTIDGTNLCAEHAADQLFAEAVRARGRCEVAVMFPLVSCGGGLQCSHIMSRSYHAVRWDEDLGAVASCAAHHVYTTHHPMEWEQAWVDHRGEDWWRVLRLTALHDPPMDPFEVIERYRP